MLVLLLVSADLGGIQTLARFDLPADRHKTSGVAHGSLVHWLNARTSGAFTELENRFRYIGKGEVRIVDLHDITTRAAF